MRTCVAENSSNDHHNEGRQDQNKVGAKHAFTLLSKYTYGENGRKPENQFWNLDSAEAAEECNDGDDCGNDDDDVGGGGVKADVKLAVKIGQHRLRLDNSIQVGLSELCKITYETSECIVW